MMTKTLRGADVVARTLDTAGMHTIFSLSGNHIMSIYDAAVDTRLELLHVRQEAAAVFMASAWARLTDNVGVALVTGGPGHTNAVAALCTPLASETPVLLLSGHARTHEIGRGGFQELPQAAMAATVAKESWTAERAADLGHDLARAVRIAASGRPGPVHLGLPSDLLEAELADDPALWPEASTFDPVVSPLSKATASAALSAIAAAKRPLIVGGPTLCSAPGRAAAREAGGCPERSRDRHGEPPRTRRPGARRGRGGVPAGRSPGVAREAPRFHPPVRGGAGRRSGLRVHRARSRRRDDPPRGAGQGRPPDTERRGVSPGVGRGALGARFGARRRRVARRGARRRGLSSARMGNHDRRRRRGASRARSLSRRSGVSGGTSRCRARLRWRRDRSVGAGRARFGTACHQRRRRLDRLRHPLRSRGLRGREGGAGRRHFGGTAPSDTTLPSSTLRSATISR